MEDENFLRKSKDMDNENNFCFRDGGDKEITTTHADYEEDCSLDDPSDCRLKNDSN